jgi:DNA-binding transcriptional regulator PaaX
MKVRATKINKIILTSLYVAGVLSVAILAPNALQYFIGKKRPDLYSVKKSFDRLLYSGCIKIVGGRAQLTKKGLLLLGGKALEGFGKTAKWNKQWHVVSFDIPERTRASRLKLRNTLKDIGFVKLQNSLWVYPYDCKSLIYIIKIEYKMGKEVVYMKAGEIENEAVLKKHFKLKAR